ncbi:AAA family ATPase [Nonomuraea wenchangensis]|uniref:AAA family ATPase n=1 Tax=Nonomuraea wenchangensis TaxID=568860 RepID=UPI00343DE461
MIRFHSLTVQNFALYPEAHIKFSTDPARPLTVIRGENECGKTTLMRAFLWVLYGEQGLPEMKEVLHPIRPVWSDDQPVQTTVELLFEVRSNRNAANYKLVRHATTSSTGGRVKYYGEEVKLYFRNISDGSWDSADSQSLALLMRRYFRPELRDFFFIDADKAVQFVGGPEGAHDDSVMRSMTTQSINNLLGLDSLRGSVERLSRRHNYHIQQAGQDSGNAQQEQLAAHLRELEDKKDHTTKELEAFQLQYASVDKDLHEYEGKLKADIARLTASTEINQQVSDAQDRLSALLEQRASLISSLSACVDRDPRLSSFLMLRAIHAVFRRLQPMKRQGLIPPSEITLLPRLLNDGKCVCGVSFAEHPERKAFVERRLADSENYQQSAQFLDNVLNCAQRLGNQAIGRSGGAWIEDVEGYRQNLGNLDQDINNIRSELDVLKEKQRDAAHALEGAAYEERDRHVQELRGIHRQLGERIAAKEKELKDINTSLRSASEKIRTLLAGQRRSQDLRDRAEVCADLETLLSSALYAIESKQVEELSNSMNRIFRDVIGATEDSHFSKVGVRTRARIASSQNDYELYAKDGKQDKPLGIANGASRRALAVSFVLALAETTASSVPFVADSLLHAFSGGVLRRMVRYLVDGQRVGQPIIFGHTHDLMDDEIRQDLIEAAGRTYTVTNQSHVGVDVVRAAPSRINGRQTVICECGINEYCHICEHVSYATDPRFTPRPNSSPL